MTSIPPNLYGEDYFFGSTEGFGYVNYETDKQAMAGELKRICRILKERIGRQGKLLDIGAATGYFVELASKQGWEAEGVELSAAAVQVGQKLGRKLTCGTIETLGGGCYEGITMLDVLEHVPDPQLTIKYVYQHLVPGGVAILNVPDFNSFFARLLGRKWHSLIPPEHLWYFTRRSLRSMLEAAGFERLEFRAPLKSFRVRYIIAIITHNKSWKWLRRFLPRLESSWLGKVSIPLPIFDNLQVIAQKSGDRNPGVCSAER